MSHSPPIQLTDLLAHRKHIGSQIDLAIRKAVEAGQWIMGPEVRDLEKELATYTEATYAITCSNGTDALILALRALRLQPGEAVICPAFTFAATAESIAVLGAVPFFADCAADSYNIDLNTVTDAILAAEKAGIRVAGIIAVDLFGEPAPYRDLWTFARSRGLWLVADAAQSFGARDEEDNHVGTLADVTTTSFFPAKPLGCYGDGGAVFTDDPNIAERVRSLRVHGKGQSKYDNIEVGFNARLDTVQAAVLSAKLRHLDWELANRRSVADCYSSLLPTGIARPTPKGSSAWAQYTIQAPTAASRDALIDTFTRNSIGCAVYYPRPLHLQTAYRAATSGRTTALPRCETYSERVLSIPMHPYLTHDEIQRVCEVAADVLDS